MTDKDGSTGSKRLTKKQEIELVKDFLSGMSVNYLALSHKKTYKEIHDIIRKRARLAT